MRPDAHTCARRRRNQTGARPHPLVLSKNPSRAPPVETSSPLPPPGLEHRVANMPQLTRHRRLGANPSPHRCRAPRWRATEARLRRHKWAHTSRASFLTATVLVTGCRAARGRASSTHALEGILHEGKSSIVRFPFYQKSIAKTYNSYSTFSVLPKVYRQNVQ